MTTRFWIYHREGWVRLSLRPGQVLHTWRAGPTDEGWSSYAESYSHEGEAIVRETVEDGRDCDGRLTRYDLAICPIDKLASRTLEYADDAPGLMPDWRSVSSRQRDEYAEAMNY